MPVGAPNLVGLSQFDNQVYFRVRRRQHRSDRSRHQKALSAVLVKFCAWHRRELICIVHGRLHEEARLHLMWPAAQDVASVQACPIYRLALPHSSTSASAASLHGKTFAVWGANSPSDRSHTLADVCRRPTLEAAYLMWG